MKSISQGQEANVNPIWFQLKIKHDRGYDKVRVLDTSRESAIASAMAMLNCPRRSIVMVRPAPVTASHLAWMHSNRPTSNLYFTRGAMRAFGDTMGNFGVSRRTVMVPTVLGERECFVLYRKRAVPSLGTKSEFFDVYTYEHVVPDTDYGTVRLAPQTLGGE